MSESMKYQWLVEGKVMLLIMQGEVQMEDLVEYDREMTAILDGMTDPIFFVSDLSRLNKFPSIGDSLKLKSLRHPKLGTAVVIGAFKNGILKFFMRVITSTFRVGYKDAATLEEAQQHILSIDPTLPAPETWNMVVRA